MKMVTKAYLVARALLEFARYDLIVRCQGPGRGAATTAPPGHGAEAGDRILARR